MIMNEAAVHTIPDCIYGGLILSFRPLEPLNTCLHNLEYTESETPEAHIFAAGDKVPDG